MSVLHDRVARARGPLAGRKSTRLVLERATVPLAAVDDLAQDFTKYAAWLLRESADGAPNLHYFIEAVETGQVAVDRRPAGRPGS
jgi:hypothetical protein